ncbi:MAG: efflux RND transporter periplasmic adaptor subunit [Pseudomonadota bacterium]
MRVLPILTALFVVAALYLLVFERDLITGGSPEEADATLETVSDTESTGSESAGSESAGSESADANIPGTEDARIAVVVQPSTARTIDNAVAVRGRTEASRQVDVKAETTGQVVSTPLRRGAFVEAGQLLCELDPGTRNATLAETRARLAEAQAGVPSAEARVSEAQAALEEALINDNAASRLSEDGFASETRVAQTRARVQAARSSVQSAESGLSAAQAAIESAQAAVAAAAKEIERLSIKAPFSGLLESDTAELGSLLQPGVSCATVIQLDPIKLVGFVAEVDVDRVEISAPARAVLVSGREVTGVVTFISRQADPLTRTFRVEVEVDNADLSIRDGQTADILVRAEGTAAHLLPGSALTLNAEGDLGVRIADAEDITRFIPVSLLRDTPKGVLVTGLAETARVIVLGQEFVTDGVPVAPTVREAE